MEGDWVTTSQIKRRTHSLCDQEIKWYWASSLRFQALPASAESPNYPETEVWVLWFTAQDVDLPWKFKSSYHHQRALWLYISELQFGGQESCYQTENFIKGFQLRKQNRSPGVGPRNATFQDRCNFQGLMCGYRAPWVNTVEWGPQCTWFGQEYEIQSYYASE